MDFLTGGYGLIIGYILPFLIVLTIVVFFHELGHFLVARWNGVAVSKFAVGFGPDLAGFTDRHGTRWALSAIPIGGYVKFIDDANAASAPEEAETLKEAGLDETTFFRNKRLWQRAAVVAAGPIANFILAIVIFTGIFYVNGRDITAAQVDAVIEGGAAESAGFETGDLVLSVDGVEIESFAELQRIVTTNAENELSFLVKRDGGEVELSAIPELQEVDDGFGGTMRIGRLGISRSADPSAVINKRYSLPGAVIEGTNETWFIMTRTVVYFAGLITGRESIDQLGGPIRVAEVSGQVAAISWVALISLTAVLSVSIGIMNLLPVPMLDGGHLVFYAIEAVRGRPLSEKTQEMGFRVGLAFVLTLMVLVTFMDVNRLVG